MTNFAVEGPEIMTKIYGYPGADQPETYEWENLIADPMNRIEAFMASIAPFHAATVVDIGSGSAFHVARYAETAAHVYAIEPSLAMLAQAFSRFARAPRHNVSLIAADAERVPLQDNIADVVHSRFAYFFGPENRHVRSCEPGIHEALRLLKREGVFFVVDNNLVEGDFARLLERYGYSGPSADRMQFTRDTFWDEQGFTKHTVHSTWSAPSGEILQRVITMEFAAQHVPAIMAEIPDASLTYAYDVYWRRKSQ